MRDEKPAVYSRGYTSEPRRVCPLRGMITPVVGGRHPINGHSETHIVVYELTSGVASVMGVLQRAVHVASCAERRGHARCIV